VKWPLKFLPTQWGVRWKINQKTISTAVLAICLSKIISKCSSISALSTTNNGKTKTVLVISDLDHLINSTFVCQFSHEKSLPNHCRYIADLITGHSLIKNVKNN